jgi:hypothetical protein
MHESIVSRETWTYECLGCLHEWQQEYEVRRSLDGHGGETTVYSRMGLLCVSPWAEPFCPSCGGYNVKILPTGWAASAAPPRQGGPTRRGRTTPSGT